ncbi:MAG: FIST N-terminal domain-containing protein, partial [Pseudomonadota bacterium]
MTGGRRPLPSCGIRTVSSVLDNTTAAVSAVHQQIGSGGWQHIVVLFSLQHDPTSVCLEIERRFPGVNYTGCSTSGEIGTDGMSDSGIVVIAFPKSGFTIASEIVHGVSHRPMERTANTVRSLRNALSTTKPDTRQSQRSDHIFGLMLVDGLSNVEEMLVTAIGWAMGDLKLIGGSSGDRLRFHQTVLIHNGAVVSDAAILLLVDSEHAFQTFKTQSFEPTDAKLVVTKADPEQRVVYELNAEPAALEYARLLGRPPGSLDTAACASHPLVITAQEEHFCRSIRTVNDDHSLTFLCAIDEGLVLTLSRQRNVITATNQAFSQLQQQLGGLELVIGFDCVLRRLDAENRQVRHVLERT